MDADPKTAKSFTGFGPTSERKLKTSKKFTQQFKEPFICLPDSNPIKMNQEDQNQNLYCAYCPSQDHRLVFEPLRNGRLCNNQNLSFYSVG